MATTKAQQVRDYLKTGSFTLDEIHAHTNIPKPSINTYLWQFKERGIVVRSGTRGKFRWAIGGEEASGTAAVQDRAGGDGGTVSGNAPAGELG